MATQEIIYLDVGGTQFRMMRDTILRYPDSLLARLVEEFPEVGKKGDPLFIDRNPLAFRWIQEIHRGGDADSVVPPLSKKCLQNELDFYQLPNASDLGLILYHPDARDFESPPLLLQIMSEIKKQNHSELFPIHVLVYYVDKLDDDFKGRRLWISSKLNQGRNGDISLHRLFYELFGKEHPSISVHHILGENNRYIYCDAWVYVHRFTAEELKELKTLGQSRHLTIETSIIDIPLQDRSEREKMLFIDRIR